MPDPSRVGSIFNLGIYVFLAEYVLGQGVRKYSPCKAISNLTVKIKQIVLETPHDDVNEEMRDEFGQPVMHKQTHIQQLQVDALILNPPTPCTTWLTRPCFQPSTVTCKVDLGLSTWPWLIFVLPPPSTYPLSSLPVYLHFFVLQLYSSSVVRLQK